MSVINSVSKAGASWTACASCEAVPAANASDSDVPAHDAPGMASMTIAITPAALACASAAVIPCLMLFIS
ncbi:MAG: hypothetical protein WDN30_04075 [Pararobbsia sp.]